MSKMSNLMLEIEESLREGESAESLAFHLSRTLGLPVGACLAVVHEVRSECENDQLT